MADYRWFVAQALPGLEETALFHLKREGIVGFSPKLEAMRAGRKVENRIYPGYIFVELESGDEAGVVNRQRGIHKVLPVHGGPPLPLPRGFVEEMREKLAGGGFDLNANARLLRKYIKGDDVPIVSGSFAGFTGEMVRYHKGSLIVLLALFGSKPREIPIPEHCVAIAA